MDLMPIYFSSTFRQPVSPPNLTSFSKSALDKNLAFKKNKAV